MSRLRTAGVTGVRASDGLPFVILIVKGSCDEAEAAGRAVQGIPVRLRWDDCGFDATALCGMEDGIGRVGMQVRRRVVLFVGWNAGCGDYCRTECAGRTGDAGGRGA